ncbi:MAG: hypothetical protein OXU53_03675 [Deltaproteobacteria bacterium]|nr:hypothetical protein [Deltaproteobacteria bacterium]
MQKKLRRIMGRDSARCGIHSDGCLLPIERGAKEGQMATKDHIIPEAYGLKRIENHILQNDWNLQPMHRVCNQARKGQVLGTIKFQCDCHGSYVDEQQNRWMMYKIGGAWQRIKYKDWGGPPLHGRIPGGNPKGFITRAKFELAKDSRGWHFDAGDRGHSFAELDFYFRLLRNAEELNRTEQWRGLAAEIETLSEQCVKDGGASFRQEGHGIEAIAKIIHWSQKIEENTASTDIARTNTEKIRTGQSPVEGIQYQLAKERSVELWYEESLNQATRHMNLREWKKAEGICEKAIDKPDRPDKPETTEVIIEFYYMKIAAAKAVQGTAEEESREAAQTFESMLNGDLGPIEASVQEIIRERDIKYTGLIVKKVAIGLGRSIMERVKKGEATISLIQT